MKSTVFLSVCSLFLICSKASTAQPLLPGQWSLSLGLGYDLPASSGMNGTRDAFESDIRRDYNNRSYPFGDDRALSGSFGGDLAYRFPNSSWSALASDRVFLSYVDNGFAPNTAFSENASMFVNAFGLGAEYTLGTPSDRFNTFARGSLILSTIFGEVNYFTERTELTPASRGGVDLMLGERWNMPFAPLALEASVDYLNANLIGKSYEAPSVSPPNTLRERALNDGANPNDPGDSPRTIAYIGFQLVARLWF
jgi:hypothetical protein